MLLLCGALSGCGKPEQPKNSASTPASAATQAQSKAQSATSPTNAPDPLNPATIKPQTVWVRYPQPNTALSPVAALGKKMFFDRSLSASGQMACATCHDPDHAYGPANGLAAQLGGTDMQHQGNRAVPSLRYMMFTPRFTRHYSLPSPDGVEDEGPTGGFTRDGGVDSLHEQAAVPLLNMNEMANHAAEEFLGRLQKTAYATEFGSVFGEESLKDAKQALQKAGLAIEAFETEDSSFQPYTSKFDSVMAGNAGFTPAEANGFRLFNNPQQANCAKCHTTTTGPGGRPAQFTDFGLIALGVPRNTELSVNRDPKYYDLGLCGPTHPDLQKETQYCGMFKTPTLRNAASRSVFFHNGRVHKLEDAIRFYVERDLHPEKWYPSKGGKVDQYDDLPPRLRANVDHVNAPFNRKAGSKPVLNDDEIADMVAFIKTLDDGYSLQAGGKAR